MKEYLCTCVFYDADQIGGILNLIVLANSEKDAQKIFASYIMDFSSNLNAEGKKSIRYGISINLLSEIKSITINPKLN